MYMYACIYKLVMGSICTIRDLFYCCEWSAAAGWCECDHQGTCIHVQSIYVDVYVRTHIYTWFRVPYVEYVVRFTVVNDPPPEYGANVLITVHIHVCICMCMYLVCQVYTDIQTYAFTLKLHTKYMYSVSGYLQHICGVQPCIYIYKYIHTKRIMFITHTHGSKQ